MEDSVVMAGADSGARRRDGTASPRKLYRSQTDRKVAGVCDGPGRLLQVDVTLVRVLFAGLAVFGGSGLVLYLAM